MSGMNGAKRAGGGSRLSRPLSETIVRILNIIVTVMAVQVPTISADTIEDKSGVKVRISIKYLCL